ncbi:MAG: GNAT family N-acetyltransferase [Pseudomonadota bacterium]
MRRVPQSYTITRADATDVPALIAVNVASDTLFADTGLIKPEDLGDHVPESVFQDAIRARDVFVMRWGEVGTVVGFTLTSVRGGTLYLDQISVHPDHGQKGLGRALMHRLLEDGRERGFKTLTLSTFKDVPWNGPFYRSLGFREIASEKLTDWMRDLEAAQAENLDISKRCFMRKRLRWL